MWFSLNQIYVLQIFTSLEYTIMSNYSIFQWDGDPFQRAAVVEYHPLNSFQLASKCHVRQGCVRECTPLNDLGGWQIDAHQIGETVDFASKMESTSKKMKIQVSEMTYRLLLDCVNLQFVMTKRMEGGIAGVEIKGKGQQLTFWIEKASPCEKCFELATGSFALVPCGHIMCADCNEKYKMLPCPTCRCKVDDRVEWRGKPTKIVDESVEVEHAPVFDEEAGLTSETML